MYTHFRQRGEKYSFIHDRITAASGQQIPWGTVLLEKLTVAQRVKNIFHLLWNPATGPYPELDESNPQLPTLFI
jgi:hypothetical protein